MSNARFAVSFEIFTAESSEYGEAAESGLINEGESLRYALTDLNRTRGQSLGVYDVHCDPCDRPRFVTVNNSQCIRTGESESRTLHIPESVSRSSARRIAQLCAATLTR